MKNITQTSKELDDVFQVKRMQVYIILYDYSVELFCTLYRRITNYSVLLTIIVVGTSTKILVQ